MVGPLRVDTATQLADLLVELHVAVQTAKDTGASSLSKRQLAGFGRRYDAVIAEGRKLNPPPPRTGNRGRPALGQAGSLLARLATHREDVLRFATDFRVPFDNNQAERDVLRSGQPFDRYGFALIAGIHAWPVKRSRSTSMALCWCLRAVLR